MVTAIYARQSINKKDSISIETQIELCRKEVRDDSEVKVYTDKGFSGKNTQRPSFKSMMEDIKQGQVKTIIVYRLDRISRSVVDFANIMDILSKYNVNFISANEKFDTSTPAGKAMLYIVMVFAQLERETIAERIKDNFYQRSSEGSWPGGPAPLGYDNTKIIINGKKVAALKENEDIEIIKRIYDEYSSSNASLGEIARKLTAERGEMWNNIKLARILHNPTYVKADVDVYSYYVSLGCIIESDISLFNGENGLYVYGKRDRAKNKYNNLKDHHITVGLHKGVISSDVWLKCQHKLSKNTQIKNSGKGKHTWLTGLVKCGYCGYAFVVRTYNKDTKYFTCSGRSIGVCKENLVTQYVDEIERIVSAAIKNYATTFSENDFIIPEVKDTSLLNDLKIELVKIEKEISGIIDSLAGANEAVIKYANERVLKLDKQREKIVNQINELNTKAVESPVIPDLNNWENETFEFKKDVANLLIDKILIYNDNVKIQWKY